MTTTYQVEAGSEYPWETRQSALASALAAAGINVTDWAIGGAVLSDGDTGYVFSGTLTVDGADSPAVRQAMSDAFASVTGYPPSIGINASGESTLATGAGGVSVVLSKPGAVSFVSDVFSAVFKLPVALAKAVWGAIRGAVTNAWASVQAGTMAPVQAIGHAFTSLTSALTSGVRAAFVGTRDAIGSAWANLLLTAKLVAGSILALVLYGGFRLAGWTA